MATRVEPVNGTIIVKAATAAAGLTHSGPQTVDTSVSCVAGDLVLDKDNGTGALQGIWLVQTGAWVLVDPGMSDGLMIEVLQGTANADHTFRVTNSVVWGTDTPTFVDQTGGATDGAVTLTGAQTLTNKKLSTGTTISVAPSFDKETNYAVSVAASTTAATAGGNLGFAGGAGNTTGAGGTASLTAGAGGNDAVGGAASVVGGAAGGGNRAGGAGALTGGAGAGSAAGGAVAATGGVGGATGAGGAATLAGGAGGATSGTGGAVAVAGGDGSAGNANGGPVTIRGGAKNGSGTAGTVTIGDVNTSSVIINNLAAAAAAGDAVRFEQGGYLIMGGSSLAADVIGAATRYLAHTGASSVSAIAIAVAVATRSGIIRNLRANLSVAPGGADTVVFTVTKITPPGAEAPTTLTCTITGAATQGSDTTHTPAVSAGDVLLIKAVSSAGTAAGPCVGFELI